MEENTFIQKFDGKIFMVKADPLHPHLAVEVRFPEVKRVEYHWVDLSREEPVQSSGYQDWWTGLYAIRGRNLVLNHFEDPSLPVHKGVEIRAIPGFDMVYEHSEATVLAESESAILLGLDQGKGIRVTDTVKGVQGREYLEEKLLDASELSAEMLAPMYAVYQKHLFAKVRSPIFDWPDTLANSSPVQEYLPQRHGAAVLNWEDHLIAAWHSPVAQGGYQLLLTCLYKGLAQWTRTLHPFLEKLNPEPFFMVGDNIVWIGERNQLCWMTLRN